MKLRGSYRLPARQERAYELLQDPDVLGQCLPGCKGLEKVGENEYAMTMNMALASISGLFDGKVRLAEQDRPKSFRLHVDGSGRIGFMKGDGILTLVTDGDATDVGYEGELQVGGTIASVGQRLMETTAKMMIKRFFDQLSKRAERGGPR